MSGQQRTDESAMRCCGGTGFADFAAVPCPADCVAVAERFAGVADRDMGSSALASHDDMVGYPATPVFEALKEELGFGDPRGAPVKPWKDISYAGGRRSLGDGGKAGVDGERDSEGGGKRSRARAAASGGAGAENSG